MNHTQDQLDRATRIIEVGRYNHSLTSKALVELIVPELQCELPGGPLSITCPECSAAPGGKCLAPKDRSWSGLSYTSTFHPVRVERANGVVKGGHYEMNSPWVVGNGAHNRFRAMGNGGQIFWVTDTDLAMQFARRIDAENFAEEDEEAWQIIQVAALQEEQKPPRTNWELSNRRQEVELMDILQLLAGQEITAGKALEAIHSRVAGNEPALPEMGSRMPRINVRSEVTDGTATGVCYPTVKRVEQEDDGSFTAVIEEQVAATREWLSEMGFVLSTPGPGAPVTTVDLRSNRTIDPVHPLLHSWEPDFSEGSGPGQCGLCGRLDDTYHVVKREALPDVHN